MNHLAKIPLRNTAFLACRRTQNSGLRCSGGTTTTTTRPLCAIGWSEFVEQTYNPKTQKWESEDPEASVMRMQEEIDSKGQALLLSPKNQRNARHIKPTTYRKNLVNKTQYERRRKEVTDLIKYIHFVKDHKRKDNW